MTLSPELNALIACCVPPDECAASLAEALKLPVNWRRLVDLCGEQRMVPLLSRALDRSGPIPLPPELLAEIREETARKTLHSLIMAAELSGVMRGFDAAGLTAIAFKGPILSYLAYGDVAVRDCDDLDIYVPRKQLKAALNLLASHGYHKSSPALEISLPGANEIALRRRNPDVAIDLHWQLTPPYFLQVDAARAVARSRMVDAFGLVARTLCPEDLLIYLCIHAARDGWTVRSICDLAALLHNQAMDWDDLLREVRRARCWRVVAVGLRLAVEIGHAPVPPEVWREVDRDPVVRGVAGRFAANLTRGEADYGGALGGAMLHLRMFDTLSSRAAYLWRRAIQPNQLDAGFIRLPDILSPAYYLIRPVRVACAALGRLRPK